MHSYCNQYENLSYNLYRLRQGKIRSQLKHEAFILQGSKRRPQYVESHTVAAATCTVMMYFILVYANLTLSPLWVLP